MKKILLAFFALLLCSVSAVAQDFATLIGGSYPGEIYLSLGTPITDDAQGVPNQKVSIMVDGENTVTLGIYDLDLGTPEEPMPLGDIVLPKLPVVYLSDGKIGFGEAEPVHLTILGEIEATAAVNTAASYILDGKAYLDIDVAWIMSEEESMPIYVRFVSTAAMQPDIAPVVANTYTGSIFLAIGEPLPEDAEGLPNQQLSVVADAANSVTLGIYGLDLGTPDEPMPMGDIVLPRRPIYMAEDGAIRFGEAAPVDLVILGEIEAKASINTETSYIREGKAYLDLDVVWVTGEENVPIYVRFVDNVISSIETATTVTAAKGIYTLSGIRLNSLDGAAKGMYIKDGKKILVK